MICDICGSEKKEYVGFCSYAGKEGNPWDCTNASCGVVKDEPTGDWYTTRTLGLSIIAPIGLLTDFERTKLTIDVTRGVYPKLRGYKELWVREWTSSAYAVYCKETDLTKAPPASFIQTIPIQSVQAQSSGGGISTSASSQPQHTQQTGIVTSLSQGSIPTGVKLQVVQDPTLDVDHLRILPQQGSGHPQKSSTPNPPTHGAFAAVVKEEMERLLAKMEDPLYWWTSE